MFQDIGGIPALPRVRVLLYACFSKIAVIDFGETRSLSL